MAINAAANIQDAKDGKPFVGLDGRPYDRNTVGYAFARAALIAVPPAQPVTIGGPSAGAAGEHPHIFKLGPPVGVGVYHGPDRRILGDRLTGRRGAVNPSGVQSHIGGPPAPNPFTSPPAGVGPHPIPTPYTVPVVVPAVPHVGATVKG
jgi:hypothetical protein